MNKFFIILKHTYFSQLKSKSFIIMTVISLIFIVGLANIQNIVELFTGDDRTEQLAVIDETGEIAAPLINTMESLDEDLELKLFEGSLDEGKELVQSGDYLALITIETDEEMLPKASYYALDLSNNRITNQLEQALSQIKTGIITEQEGLDQEVINKMFTPVPIERIALKENAKTEEELNQARGLVYFMIFLIYFAVIMYGSMIANQVAIEKSSRVMEIIVSSVSPITQMFAKITGVALLGLTQFGLIIITGYLSLKMNQSEMVGGFFEYFGFGDIPVATIIYGVVFFILGYLLYAMLAAMLGSLVTRIEDAQQVITPMIMLIVAAFMIAVFGLNEPDSSFVVATSFIPFFTPIIMFVRVGMLDIPLWEVALSIGLLMATIFFFAWIGARVYKGGVLMYGRSTSLKDLKKALQMSKKDV
ncbi:ABC transporter permease [Melghiribacillus thermohalophilus]|nr:ABC transporter permease [Melghiribacillus thermohalophilus]